MKCEMKPRKKNCGNIEMDGDAWLSYDEPFMRRTKYKIISNRNFSSHE
jgi:hypothetical protein